ncbi:MAG: HEAT repeat domain-containing protein [Planctomycetia bacterium]|nr:HEAT repeat domain-containing protein [Planctomycetia bacterium]
MPHFSNRQAKYLGKIDWTAPSSQLAALLDDERFAVRDRAIRELTLRGDGAIASLTLATTSPSVRTRRNAVWALSRIDSPAATEAIRKCLADENPGVRQAAVVSLGVRGEQAALPDLIAQLSDSAPEVQRDAATSLGKINSAAAVPGILNALKEEQIDRFREHALIYALIDIEARAETIVGLTSDNAGVRRAALIALDQMNGGNLQRSQVTALLATSDLALQRAAIDVIAGHPEWSEEVVAAVRPLLASTHRDSEQAASARSLLLAFAANEEVQAFIAKSLAESGSEKVTLLTLLDVVRDASVSAVPEAWAAGVARHLRSEDPEIVDSAVAAAEGVKSTTIDEALHLIAHDEKRPADLRVRAAAAMADGLVLDESLFAFLKSQLSNDAPFTMRLAAARAIGSAKLSSNQLSSLTEGLAHAGPLELASLLAAYEDANDNSLGKQLIMGLTKSPGLTSLSPSTLDRVFVGFSADVQQGVSKLRSQMGSSNEEQVARLAQLEGSMAGGDPLRGKVIFEGQRTSCVACHAVQGRGGRIGPDLSTTGARRNTRDLSEAVLYPSASLARGFETFGVLTSDGKVHTGLILSESTDAIRLRTTQQTELIVRRNDIEELQPSPVSVMPGGLDRTMSEDELRDLVAYLVTLR